MAVVSAGIVPLLGWLDDRMNMDRDDWADAAYGWEFWPTHVLVAQSRRLESVLERLVENNVVRNAKVAAAVAEVIDNVHVLDTSGIDADQRERALYAAQQGFLRLRGYLYAWGYRSRLATDQVPQWESGNIGSPRPKTQMPETDSIDPASAKS